MSGTHLRRVPLSSYLDAITELLDAGEPFGDVEEAINGVADLTPDEKSALWLFAFSMRAADDQGTDARPHLAAVK